MISMTGYGAKERLEESFLLQIEMKSYNSRYLDIKTNISPSLSMYEQELVKLIKDIAQRGSVELTVRLKKISSDAELILDRALVEKYAAVYAQIAEISHTSYEPSLQDFTAVEGVVNQVYKQNAEVYRDPLFSLFDDVLSEFIGSRKREGGATREHIVSLHARMRELTETVASYGDLLEAKLRENLENRVSDLLEGSEYDESRLLQEVAILVVKYSIQEEIIRLRTHLDAFTVILEEAGPIGKKLDFLCQEMNREINTIGSKSSVAEVNHLVVELKDQLENIREQVRNVE